jgi:hypothetical protein
VDPAFVREFQGSTLAGPPSLICGDKLGNLDRIALRFSSIGAFAIGSQSGLLDMRTAGREVMTLAFSADYQL